MARLLRTRPLLAVVIATLMTVMVAATSVFAAGAITGKDYGAFMVLDNQVGYAPGQTYTATMPAGSLIDTGINRVAAGASFGWHEHNATVVVAVTAGTLTFYSPTCDSQSVSAGQGFIELPDTIHLARNEGDTTAVVVWTYLGVPAGEPEDVYLPASYDPCGGIF